MQKSIIAGSMAVLAMGATIPHQNNINAQMMAKVKDQMKGLQAPQTQSFGQIASSPRVTAQNVVATSLRRGKNGKGKGKGKDDDDHGDDEDGDDAAVVAKQFFEVSYSSTDSCDDSRVKTFGFELGLCLDYVDKDESGYGLPRSHHFLVGEDGSAPAKVEAFMSHGCMGSVAATQSLNPEDVGLPSDYTIGDCVDLGGYYAKAAYYDSRHVPTYDAVTFGYGVDAKGCLEGTIFEYNIDRVMSCSEDEGVFYSYDLTNCATGSIIRHEYSDDTCATMTSSAEKKNTQCLFDLEEFFAEYSEASYSGYFEYAVSACHVEA